MNERSDLSPAMAAGLAPLLGAVEPVASRFIEAGHRLFLVGGVVRDLALAESAESAVSDESAVSGQRMAPPVSHDIDLTTDAHPRQIKALVSPAAEAVWTQGERFGTIGARVGGWDLEITTHRAEAYDEGSRKPEVRFGQDLVEDLSRRDFTVNAMAIEVPDGILQDPFDGLGDLRARVLATPLSPELSFTDDPLRMLRAARFIPRFGLTPKPELVVAATELAPRLAIVSVERVADELERLLDVEAPRAGLRFLAEVGLLPLVLPGLADDPAGLESAVELASRIAVAPIGPERPVGKGPDAVDPVGGGAGSGSAEANRLARRAALLWPLGPIGAKAALERLRYPRLDVARTAAVMAAAEDALAQPLEPSTVRRVADRVGPDGLPVVAALAAEVAAGLDGRDDLSDGGLARMIDRVQSTEDLSDLDAPLSGRRVMEVLGLAPGPEVGAALAHLRHLRLERGPITVDQAEAELAAWWRGRSPG